MHIRFSYTSLDLQKPEDLTVSMRKAFLELDAELRQMDAVKRGDDHSGSTAITAMVTPTHIIAANCGDSRSILVTSSGVKAMSEDHKPYNVSPPAAAKQHSPHGPRFAARRARAYSKGRWHCEHAPCERRLGCLPRPG